MEVTRCNLLIFLWLTVNGSSSIGSAAIKADTIRYVTAAEKMEIDAIDWDAFYADMSDLAAGDDEKMEQWADEVQALLEHPLSLNTASTEALANLPFVNDQLVEAISYYRYRYGPIKDVAELQLIDGMDNVRYRWLKHLVVPGDTAINDNRHLAIKSVIDYGKSDLRLLTCRVLENKRGYSKQATEDQRYAGDAWAMTLKYTFSFKQRVHFGVTAQKDAGERWLTGQSTPDYLSMHASLHKIGRFNTLIVGDFNATMGLGLVCGQSFRLGKGVVAGQYNASGASLKRHASTAESGFYRGIGVDVQLIDGLKTHQKSFNLSWLGFLSQRSIDGAISDTAFTRILNTGLHRTSSEVNERKNIGLFTVGSCLRFRVQSAQLSLNQLAWTFSKPLEPSKEPYNQFVTRGKKGYCQSMDYRVFIDPFTFFGELSVDNKGYAAYLGGLYVTPISSLSLSIQYRNYGKKYNAPFANAFGEHETANNEKGWYGSLSWDVAERLVVTAYYDTYSFPWLTYSTDEIAYGYERGIQGNLRLNTSTTLVVRYKNRLRFINVLTEGDKNPTIDPTTLQQMRATIEERISNIVVQTGVDLTRYDLQSTQSTSWGYALTQSIVYTFRSLPVKASGKLSFFDIPNYENRISSYETAIPGTMSRPILYGEGCRLNLTADWELLNNVHCWIKASRWFYTNKTQVGTGSETIEGNHATEVQFQARLTL